MEGFLMQIPTRDGYFNRYKLAGFGLIEILITIVVIGVGLLTIAGLYSRTMSASVVSKQRSEAVVIAESMLEHVWIKDYNKRLFNLNHRKKVLVFAKYEKIPRWKKIQQAELTYIVNYFMSKEENN